MEFLKEDCKENPAQTFCRIHTVRNRKFYGINAGEVNSETAEPGEEEDFTKPIVAVRNNWKQQWTVQKQNSEASDTDNDNGSGPGNGSGSGNGGDNDESEEDDEEGE